MIALADVIHFLSIDPKLQKHLPELYSNNKQLFERALNYIFDIERREQLKEMIGYPVKTSPSYVPTLQFEMDQAMSLVADYMHKHLSQSNEEYLMRRGITREQINRYKIGDNSVSIPFLGDLEWHLVNNYVRVEVATRIKSCLGHYVNEIKGRYGSGYAISFPSYDAKGNFKGIVFRTVGFVKTNETRNMYKFYSPYSYSFLFNEGALEKYDEVYLVEGVADALALIRLGYDNVISPSMVRITESHVKKIVDNNVKVNVIFDQDQGGFAGLRHVQAALPKEHLGTLACTPSPRDLDEEIPSRIHEYLEKLEAFDIRKVLVNKPEG
ncbi:MAG: toprim domain-containing protein [Actinobacteria bacterium]|nr:toprim domain-containing protein [Actinomycetota bacterium]